MNKHFLFLFLIFIMSIASVSVFGALSADVTDSQGSLSQSITALSYAQVTSKVGIVSISKELDASSPLLFQAMEQGQKIQKLDIKFKRLDPTGQQEHYFTISLENAKVEFISPNFPLTFVANNSAYKHLEDIFFSYEKITFVDEINGKSSSGNSVVQAEGFLENAWNVIKNIFS